MDKLRAVPAPARAGEGVRFRFDLSKISRVGIVVRADAGSAAGGRASAGRVYLSTSATFAHGERYFRWVPPRLRKGAVLRLHALRA